MESVHSTVPPALTDPVCALALGTVSEPFRVQLFDRLPTALHAAQPDRTWSLHALTDSTDALWDCLDQEPVAPWTTLLVTSELYGSRSLAETLIAIRKKWPTVRIAVIVSRLTQDTRQLIANCAAFQIYNVRVGDKFTVSQIVELLTQDFSWDAVQPYLDAPATMTLPTASSAPSPAPVSPSEGASASSVVSSYTVAVVSGKGGVGKTGLIANLLTVTGQWPAVALDLDYIKPSLPLYFHEANDTPTLDLRRLLTQIQTHHRPPMGTASMAVIENLTEDDTRDIAQYVEHAEVVTPSAKIVPGASRFETVMPVPPPVVMSAILSACQRQARFVFVDTPGVPTDPVWIQSVRQADFVVIVTTPEYAVLLETIDLIRKLDLLQIPREKRGLIINKRSKWGYSTAAIRSTHLPGVPLLGEIPYDPARWERSLQQHRPLALDHPKPWRALFHAITQVEPERPARRGWFRRKSSS